MLPINNLKIKPSKRELGNLYSLIFVLSLLGFFIFPRIGILGFLFSFIIWTSVIFSIIYLTDKYSNREIISRKNQSIIKDNFVKKSRHKKIDVEFDKVIKILGEINAQGFENQRRIDDIIIQQKDQSVFFSKWIDKINIGSVFQELTVKTQEGEVPRRKMYRGLVAPLYGDLNSIENLFGEFGKIIDSEKKGLVSPSVVILTRAELLRKLKKEKDRLNNIDTGNMTSTIFLQSMFHLMINYLEDNFNIIGRLGYGPYIGTTISNPQESENDNNF